jgi:hypothetical protein
MEGKYHLCLIGVGKNAELTQPVGGWVALSQSGKNKTFYHLGETWTEIKLTNFQEKRDGPKS